MPGSSSAPPWASLPPELLELLLGFQNSFFDQLRFGAVCKSWRDAAAAFKRDPGRRRRAAPSLPVLTFPDDKVLTKYGRRRRGEAEAAAASSADVDEAAAAPITTRCFYSLSDDRVYRLQAPRESRDWYCWGSSHGWLAMVDLSAKPFLFNPISGARVDLPSLATLTWIIRAVEWDEDGATVYTCHHPFDEAAKPYRFDGESIQRYFAIKLVLSSSPLDPSCVAMAMVSLYLLLVYTRPGDDSWIEVPTGLERFRDIIYHNHNRRFYALTNLGKTIAVKFKDPGSPANPGNCCHVQPVVELTVPAHDPHYGWRDGMYLVALPSGELIRVIRGADPPKNVDPHGTEAFTIYGLEVGSEGGGQWVEVDRIGDYCLFLGFNHSMSLPGSEVLGKSTANCIFFTNDPREVYFRKHGGDFGVFNIERGSVERFCHREKVKRILPPPMWITLGI